MNSAHIWRLHLPLWGPDRPILQSPVRATLVIPPGSNTPLGHMIAEKRAKSRLKSRGAGTRALSTRAEEEGPQEAAKPFSCTEDRSKQ